MPNERPGGGRALTDAWIGGSESERVLCVSHRGVCVLFVVLEHFSNSRRKLREAALPVGAGRNSDPCCKKSRRDWDLNLCHLSNRKQAY